MRYNYMVDNGESVGLRVQGCHFRCRGCCAIDTWSFSEGDLWDDKAKSKFFSLIENSDGNEVYISGGEPLADENLYDVASLIIEIKEKYPDKRIILYTGYEWNKITMVNSVNSSEALVRCLTVALVDVVVDGKYMSEYDSKRYDNNQPVGSINQHIIDVKQTLKNHYITQWKDENNEK